MVNPSIEMSHGRKSIAVLEWVAIWDMRWIIAKFKEVHMQAIISSIFGESGLIIAKR